MIRKLWHDEKPKHSGHYWFKYADDSMVRPGEVVMVEVKRGKAHFYVYDLPTRPVSLKECPDGKWHGPVPFPALARANKHEQGLKDLTEAVLLFLHQLDIEMRQPSTPERGSRIAKLSNYLDRANDSARYFALGVGIKGDDKEKAVKKLLKKMAAK